MSLEYSVLGLQNSNYTIEPWDPIDSLAWLKALAWDLRGNMDDEITRATLLASGLTRAQVESLYPAYPFGQNRPIVGHRYRAQRRIHHRSAAGHGRRGSVPVAIVPASRTGALTAWPRCDRYRRHPVAGRRQLPGHRLELLGDLRQR